MTKFTEITAAVTECKGADFELKQLKIREPQNDEVLVKIVATGMCHTDLIVRDQYYPVPLPAVLGHEGSGIIEAIGPNVKDLAVGDHVVLSYGFCGSCEQCSSGQPAYCQDFLDETSVVEIQMGILPYARTIIIKFMIISLRNLRLQPTPSAVKIMP